MCSKNIGIKETIYGTLTSIILYGLIALAYIIQSKAWGLSPFFRIPFIMIFLPFIAHLVTERNERPRVKFISKILLLSTGITVIFGTVFHEIFFDIMEYVGTKKSY
jgi:uncharacterized membrane protein